MMRQSPENKTFNSAILSPAGAFVALAGGVLLSAAAWRLSHYGGMVLGLFSAAAVFGLAFPFCKVNSNAINLWIWPGWCPYLWEDLEHMNVQVERIWTSRGSQWIQVLYLDFSGDSALRVPFLSPKCEAILRAGILFAPKKPLASECWRLVAQLDNRGFSGPSANAPLAAVALVSLMLLFSPWVLRTRHLLPEEFLVVQAFGAVILAGTVAAFASNRVKK